MRFYFFLFVVLVIPGSLVAQQSNGSHRSDQQIIRILNEPVSKDEQDEPDSLGSAELDHEILDSNVINKHQLYRDKLTPNVVTYQDEGIKLAYYTKDKNKWTSINLPFTNTSSDIRIVDIGNIGQTEIVVKGEVAIYGTGAGTTKYVLLVLSTGNTPKQLLKLTYGWGEESFGDKSNNGVGGYIHDSMRKVSITNQGIFLYGEPNVKAGDYDIPNGKYIIKNGKIVGANEEDFIKPNERVLLDFNTFQGKRLVIVIDHNKKYLIYRYGSQNHVELQFPSSPENGIALFKYAYQPKDRELRSDISYTQLHFTNKGFLYNVYNQYDQLGNIIKIGLIVTDLSTNKKTLIQGNISSLNGDLAQLENLKIKLQKDFLFDVY